MQSKTRTRSSTPATNNALLWFSTDSIYYGVYLNPDLL